MKKGSRRINSSSYTGRLIVGLMVFATTVLAKGEMPPIYLILSGEQSYYHETSIAFKKELAGQENAPSVELYTLKQARQIQHMGGATVVTIGSAASEFALNRFPDTDILSLLIPITTWHELLNRMPAGNGRRAAVVIDQPLSRSLVLGKLLVPEVKQVSAVFGSASIASKPQLMSAAEGMGIKLLHADLANDDNPIGVLGPLVKKSEFFIAVADRAVFNKSVAKWLLYLSFRQKVPVIGFSKSYVDAGALAAVFSSPDNIGRHGAELTASLLATDLTTGWRTYYSAYHTIEVNREVARALSINIPDLKLLYKQYSSLIGPAL